MATWTLTQTSDISDIGRDLDQPVALSGAQPADFNPDAIIEIRMRRTLVVSGLVDDSVTDGVDMRVLNDSGQTVVSLLGSRSTRTTDGSWTYGPVVVSGQPTNLPSATGMYATGALITAWATYNSNMKNDDATTTVTGAVVEIEYTPGAPPVASFTKDKTTVYTGQQIQFTDTSTGGVTSRSWDFGGGASGSTAQNPLVTFNTPGVFNVTVTATNGFGQNTSAPQQITVLKREAEVWNGAAWVGGESWNGVAWVVPEVWDGVQWVPMRAP